MIKIAVCDDERCYIHAISCFINEYRKENQVSIDIATYTSGEELLNSKWDYDLIFLDIEMGGMNGLETAKRIRLIDKSVCIVYVTSHTDFTRRAFSVHAFDYVVKPFSRKDIKRVLEDYVSYINEQIVQNVSFKTDHGIVVQNIEDIYYLEYVDKRKIVLQTVDGVYYIKSTLSEILESLKDYHFVSPHKSFIVNLMHVKKISGYDIVLTNGDIIPIAQRRLTEFRTNFHLFLHTLSTN